MGSAGFARAGTVAGVAAYGQIGGGGGGFDCFGGVGWVEGDFTELGFGPGDLAELAIVGAAVAGAGGGALGLRGEDDEGGLLVAAFLDDDFAAEGLGDFVLAGEFPERGRHVVLAG